MRLLIGLLFSTWIFAAEAAWPEKPIRLIVPYPPGGLTDAVARQVGVALAKVKPGTLNFGSTGAGGLSHLVGELLKSSTGTQMTHIAYKGAGPATNDLLGGQIQLMFNDTSLPHVKADKLRALAVTGPKRWSDLPGVPTMAELGMPGYETYNWFGLFVPAGTPAAIIAQLNRELVAAMKEPAMQAWMQARGAEAVSSSPEYFAAYIRKDVDKWAQVVKAVGLVPE